MHLRHGHGHATTHTRHTQQPLRLGDRQTKRTVRCHHPVFIHRCSGLHRCLGSHAQGQQGHANAAKQSYADVGGAPTHLGDTPLGNGRPHSACQTVATGAHCDSNATAFVPPLRGVCQQRRKGRSNAQQTQQTLRQGKADNAARHTGQHKARCHTHRTHAQYSCNAKAIGPAAHPHAAYAKAQHAQGVGDGRVSAADTKFGLHRGQHHRHHIHAAVAQQHQQQGGEQTPRRLGRVDGGVDGFIHG